MKLQATFQSGVEDALTLFILIIYLWNKRAANERLHSGESIEISRKSKIACNYKAYFISST